MKRWLPSPLLSAALCVMWLLLNDTLSLGNILFFGVGMYACAVTQIAMFSDVAQYTAAFGAIKVDFSAAQYFGGLALGLLAGALVATAVAALLSWVLFGLRGPYFAIGTLGAAIAAAELTGAWDYVGGGGGIAMPVYPGDPDTSQTLRSSVRVRAECLYTSANTTRCELAP
jgi:branched-chain amino acid transport system permease protein